LVKEADLTQILKHSGEENSRQLSIEEGSKEATMANAGKITEW